MYSISAGPGQGWHKEKDMIETGDLKGLRYSSGKTE